MCSEYREVEPGICVECEEHPATKPDPRDPPLETGDCLCRTCWQSAREQVIDDLYGQIADLES